MITVTFETMLSVDNTRDMSLFRVNKTNLECSRESISHAIASVTFHAIAVPLLACLFSYGGGLNDVTTEQFTIRVPRLQCTTATLPSKTRSEVIEEQCEVFDHFISS